MKRFAIVLFALAACAAPVVRHDRIARAVVIGDSVAHGAGDETGLGIAGYLDRELHVRTANLGINGARTYDVLRLLRDRSVRSIVGAADLVILSIGGNDLYGDTIARVRALALPDLAMRRVISNVRMIVGSVERINGSARIVLVGLYDPYRSPFLDEQVNRWDSRLIATFAADRAVTVIRIADMLQSPARLSPIDQFHPSASGYALIAARIAISVDPR